jgi:hypothetical protein
LVLAAQHQLAANSLLVMELPAVLFVPPMVVLVVLPTWKVG